MPPDEEEFFREMTELCRKHGLGIAGPFEVFVMEPDDYEREHRERPDGRWEFF